MADKRSRRISTFGSRITSLVSVALVLVLLGVAALMGIAGKNLTDDVRRNLGFVIKMERDVPESVVNQLKQALLASEAVELLTYNSAEDILAQESEYLGEDVSSLLDANPYASEFDIKVRPTYASPDSIAALVDMYDSFQGVNEIVTESAVIEGVDSTLRRVGAILLAVAVVLLAVSIALINNTISLSIYARRFVIHTMKLVGATGSFIRRPFLIAGMVNGLLAGSVASVLLVVARFYISSLDPLLEEALPWLYVAVVCGVLVVIGTLICVLTAVFATNRYIRSSYDEMFLK